MVYLVQDVDHRGVFERTHDHCEGVYPLQVGEHLPADSGTFAEALGWGRQVQEGDLRRGDFLGVFDTGEYFEPGVEDFGHTKSWAVRTGRCLCLSPGSGVEDCGLAALRQAYYAYFQICLDLGFFGFGFQRPGSGLNSYQFRFGRGRAGHVL